MDQSRAKKPCSAGAGSSEPPVSGSSMPSVEMTNWTESGSPLRSSRKDSGVYSLVLLKADASLDLTGSGNFADTIDLNKSPAA